MTKICVELVLEVCWYKSSRFWLNWKSWGALFFLRGWPQCVACGILVPRLGLELGPRQWKHWVLTAGPSREFRGRSLNDTDTHRKFLGYLVGESVIWVDHRVLAVGQCSELAVRPGGCQVMVQGVGAARCADMKCSRGLCTFIREKQGLESWDWEAGFQGKRLEERKHATHDLSLALLDSHLCPLPSHKTFPSMHLSQR